VYITHHAIKLHEFLCRPADPVCGASSSFVGVVRNHHEGKIVEKLFYECYEPMAEKQIGRIIHHVQRETSAHAIRVVHRVGWLTIGEAAVAIVVDAPHRAEAFLACRQVIDRIKHEAPIWKKEIYADGSATWTSCAIHEEVAQ